MINIKIQSNKFDFSKEINLDFLSEKYFNYNKVSYKEIVGTGKKEVEFSEVDIDKASFYACEDADMTLKLWHALRKLLINGA